MKRISFNFLLMASVFFFGIEVYLQINQLNGTFIIISRLLALIFGGIAASRLISKYVFKTK
jgi:hypothetical protein